MMFVVQTRVGQPPGVTELTDNVPLTSRDTPKTMPGVSCPFAVRTVLTKAQPIIALSILPYIDFPFFVFDFRASDVDRTRCDLRPQFLITVDKEHPFRLVVNRNFGSLS